MDPSAPYNDPNLTSAMSGYENAANTANQYQSASALLPAALKNAINEKIDYNKGLIEQKNKSMVDYFNAPSQARLDYQDIFNPFQREALVQKATNNAYLPYANNMDALTQRMGSIQDIINTATGAFGAQVSGAQGAAQLALQKYNNLFGLAGAKSDAAYKNAQLNLDYKKLAQSGSDSGSALGGLGDLFTVDANGNLVLKSTPQASSGVPTEPQPTTPPPSGPKYTNTKWRSPQGQWEWNTNYQSWVPAGANVTQ